MDSVSIDQTFYKPLDSDAGCNSVGRKEKPLLRICIYFYQSKYLACALVGNDAPHGQLVSMKNGAILYVYVFLFNLFYCDKKLKIHPLNKC